MIRRIFAASSVLALALVACSGGNDTAVPRELLRFGSASVPPAFKDEAFSHTLSLVGAVGTAQYRLAAGDLPPGLTLSGSTLSGTPTQPGSYTFSVRASDASLSSTVQQFSVAVQEVPIPTLALELPLTEVRDTTRVPLRISGARKVQSARLVWRIPEGVSVASIQPGPAKPLIFSQVKDGKLTLDMGFANAPASSDVLAFLSLKMTKPAKMPTSTLGYEVRSSEGKVLNKIVLEPPPTPAPTPVPASKPAPAAPSTPPAANPPGDSPEVPQGTDSPETPEGTDTPGSTETPEAPAAPTGEDGTTPVTAPPPATTPPVAPLPTPPVVPPVSPPPTPPGNGGNP